MVYSKPCEMADIYCDFPDHLKNVVLFGDDFSGYAGGFDQIRHLLVEISSADWSIITYGRSFSEFISEKLDDALA